MPASVFNQPIIVNGITPGTPVDQLMTGNGVGAPSTGTHPAEFTCYGTVVLRAYPGTCHVIEGNGGDNCGVVWNIALGVYSALTFAYPGPAGPTAPGGKEVFAIGVAAAAMGPGAVFGAQYGGTYFEFSFFPDETKGGVASWVQRGNIGGGQVGEYLRERWFTDGRMIVYGLLKDAGGRNNQEPYDFGDQYYPPKIRTIYPNGDYVIGGGALATDATAGFLVIPTCPGMPTGTPTSYPGEAHLVIDSVCKKLYANIGGVWTAL